MKKKLSLGLLPALAITTAALVDCAQGSVEFEDDGDETAASTATGTGGSGGSVAGTGGTPDPCPLDCSTIDTPPCQVSICNTGTKQCEVVDDVDGTACDDGLFCTTDDACSAGVCTGGPPNDCGMNGTPCQEIVCDETTQSCSTMNLAEGATCTPTDLCMLGATCTNGQCLGTPNDCFLQPVPNDCHVSVCNPMNGMCEPQPGNEGQACTDPNLGCPVCSSGQCVDGLVNQTVYFQETFANNTAGWTLDTEWQIGPAMTSTGHTSSCGNGDPGTDHTPSTTDNGVAGVVIGGNAATNTHPFRYLTSPAINVANVSGPLWLGFSRWLNSDYTPYMQNVVEVWNGSAWVSLWQTGGSPGIKDGAWTPQAFDITNYKNSALKVRFGFNIGSSGVYTCSQWNVDDVVIADVVCQ